MKEESRKHQQRFSRDRPLASVLVSSYTIHSQESYIFKYTKTCLALLAFMTLKPFHPTLKLLFLHHNQDRVIKSASLNVAQVISMQPNTEATEAPISELWLLRKPSTSVHNL